MSQALTNLLSLLNLEKIEEGLFRGQSEDLGLRQVFGGQVVGSGVIRGKRNRTGRQAGALFSQLFSAPAIARNPLSMTLKYYVTVTALAPVAWRPFKTENRFFI
jgi:acyl-CoA thioesterase-2